MKNRTVITLLLLVFMITNMLFAQPGLKAEYYNGTDFNEKVATRIDEKIDFFWLNEPPVPGLNPNECSVRWTGRIVAPESGTYNFSARVDDGIRVWVGDQLVIDNWNLNDLGIFSGQVTLEKGKSYNLRVDYFNGLIEAEVRLLWELPSEISSSPSFLGRSYKVVPSKYFIQKPPQKTKTNTPAAKDKVTPAPKPVRRPTVTKPTDGKEAALHRDTLERYIPKHINFEKGKSIMLTSSEAELDDLATFLLRNPELKLKIEGHTDIVGDPDKNWKLSEERAYVVANYLVKKGIEAKRIQAKGYGSSRPLVTGDPKKDYPVNRRVEFILY